MQNMLIWRHEKKLPDQAAELARKEPLGRHNGMMFPTDELSAPARGGAGTGLPAILAPAARAPARIRRRSLRPCPGGGGTALAPRRQDAAAGPGSAGEAPRTPLGKLASRPAPGIRNQTPPRPVPRNPQTEQANRERCCCTALPRARATRRPPGPGSSRSCRAARGPRTPGPPWCSRCCSTGTPGRSPGCWAAKTLRVRGREKRNTAAEIPPGPEQRRPTQISPLREEGRGVVPSYMLRRCLPPPAKVNSDSNDGRKTTSGLGAISHPQGSYLPTDLRPCLGQPEAEAKYYKI